MYDSDGSVREKKPKEVTVKKKLEDYMKKGELPPVYRAGSYKRKCAKCAHMTDLKAGPSGVRTHGFCAFQNRIVAGSSTCVGFMTRKGKYEND